MHRPSSDPIDEIVSFGSILAWLAVAFEVNTAWFLFRDRSDSRLIGVPGILLQSVLQRSSACIDTCQGNFASWFACNAHIFIGKDTLKT
jgi:hypothetical protein